MRSFLPTSSWRDVEPRRRFPAVETSFLVDIAIVGGGLTGVTAAYLLRASGKTVALLEAETIGYQSSGATTGFLMETVDTDATELISRFGADEARRIFTSHRKAIDHIEQIVHSETIACEFTRCPAFLYAESPREARRLKDEARALHSLGVRAHFDPAVVLPFPNAGALCVERQAKFHPLKYLYSLAESAHGSGVRLFEYSQVGRIRRTNGAHELELTSGHRIRANHVCIATHYPLDPQPKQLRYKKAWYTTYAIEASIPHDLFPNALFEDQQVPYHYMRVDHGFRGDRLILGGEDHRSDIPFPAEKNFEYLEAHLKRILGDIPHEIRRKWYGRIVEPGDGIAYIGELDIPGIFYATGFSGSGITYATIAAEAFADSVMQRANQSLITYAARRPVQLKTHGPKAIEYFREFFTVLGKHMKRPRP